MGNQPIAAILRIKKAEESILNLFQTFAERWSILYSNLARYSSQLFLFGLIFLLLGTDTAGEYAYSLAFTAPIYIFFGFGIRQLLLTDSSGEKFISFFLIRLAGSFFALLTVFIFSYFINPLNPLLLIGVAIFKSVESIFDIAMAKIQERKNYQGLFVLSSTSLLLQLLITFASLYLLKSALLAVLTNASIVALLTLFIFVKFKDIFLVSSETVLLRNKRRFHKIFLSAIQTGFSDSLITFTYSLPLLFVGWLEGPRSVTSLAFLMYFVTAYEMYLNSSAQKSINHVKVEAKNNFVSKRMIFHEIQKEKLFIIGFGLLCVCLFPIANLWMPVASTSSIIPLFVSSGLLFFSLPLVFFLNIAMQMNYFYSKLLLIAVVTASAAIPINFYLISSMGAIGGLMALGVTSIIRFVAAYLALKE